MPFKPASLLSVAALSCSILACGQEDTGTAFNICDDFDTPYTAFSAGMTVAGDKGKVKIRLVSGDPAPPKRGANSWTLQIVDSSDQPLADSEVTQVKPWMPDHGHGTSTAATSEGVEIADLACDASPTACRAKAAGDGTVVVDDIDLRMAGVWTVTVSVALADGSSDEATFAFCIDG